MSHAAPPPPFPHCPAHRPHPEPVPKLLGKAHRDASETRQRHPVLVGSGPAGEEKVQKCYSRRARRHVLYFVSGKPVVGLKLRLRRRTIPTDLRKFLRQQEQPVSHRRQGARAWRRLVAMARHDGKAGGGGRPPPWPAGALEPRDRNHRNPRQGPRQRRCEQGAQLYSAHMCAHKGDDPGGQRGPGVGVACSATGGVCAGSGTRVSVQAWAVGRGEWWHGSRGNSSSVHALRYCRKSVIHQPSSMHCSNRAMGSTQQAMAWSAAHPAAAASCASALPYSQVLSHRQSRLDPQARATPTRAATSATPAVRGALHSSS